MAVAESWSNLPEELVEKIAEFVTSYGDYIRARAVCLSWQSALPKTPKHLPTQFPLLLLPGGTNTHKDLFSLAKNKSYRLEFPSEVHYKSICGSYHGWLVIKNGNSSLGLFNPFSKAHIDLPSLGLPPTVFDNEYRFVLSSSPSSSDFMAIASCKFLRGLWFYRCGDERWTDMVLSPAGILRSFEDLIFHKNQIVAARRGEIYIMEINILDEKNSSTEIKVKQTIIAPYIIPPVEFITFMTPPTDLYLVESEDEVLIIRQFNYYMDNYDRIAVLFDVCKLDWNKSSTGVIEAKWSDEVKSLDNKMFFLGMGPCSYFSSSGFNGCRGNSLYFRNRTGGNVAMFDLKDRRTKPLPCYPEGPLVFLPSPTAIWLTPSPV